MLSYSRENLISIFYGSLLIISLELLFLKLLPGIYPLINTLPLLFLSQIIRIDLLFFSLTTSMFFFLFTFLNNFLNNIISLKLLLNFFTISTIVFFFTFLISENEKKKVTNKKIIVYLTFFSLFIAGLLSFLFFSNIEQNQLREYLTKFTNEFLKLKDMPNDVDTLPLIELIINIIPSINVFSFLTTLLINFNITSFLIRKLNFINKYSFDVFEFEIPTLVFFLFNVLIVLSTQTSGNLNYFFLNCAIGLSFLIFYEGFISFYKSFKELEINNYLKIIIIFLLFIFLGYVLFLILFLLGFFINLKKITKRIVKY